MPPTRNKSAKSLSVDEIRKKMLAAVRASDEALATKGIYIPRDDEPEFR